jgi:hypothetical protein
MTRWGRGKKHRPGSFRRRVCAQLLLLLKRMDDEVLLELLVGVVDAELLE